MRILLEEEYKKLWCPNVRVRPIVGAEFSVNRHRDGEPPHNAKCIGSACAAWDWETERPSDGFHYIKVSIRFEKPVEEYPSWVAEKTEELKKRPAHFGWEFWGIDGSESRYTTQIFTFRKPWEPRGFCAAFHRQPSES